MAYLTCKIRTFQPGDLPQILALQGIYQRLYPDYVVRSEQTYLSPLFEKGENIFCALDEHEVLQGYAPLLIRFASGSAEIPHTVWTEIMVDPGLESKTVVKDQLFERVVERAKALTEAFPGHPVNLAFQYYPSEMESIAYVRSKGARYTESVFSMQRELTEAVTAIPFPEGVEVRPWHMDTAAEQEAYTRAYNAAFPHRRTELAEWQHFFSSPAWKSGTAITASAGNRVVGSVSVFWNEEANRKAGKKFGIMDNVFVDREWRRQGIAAYLVAQGIRYLQEQGLKIALLEMRAKNRQALKLYLNSGYRVIKESHFYVLRLQGKSQ